MARFLIKAAQAKFTGVVGGVAFANGEATFDASTHPRALAYFQRRTGYQVIDLDKAAAEAVEAEPATTDEAAKGAKGKGRGGRKAVQDDPEAKAKADAEAAEKEAADKAAEEAQRLAAEGGGQ